MSDSSTSSFALLLGGILQTSVGDAAGLRAPKHLLALPRPAGPVTLATPSHVLSAPLRTLAQRLKPERICVDQGGAGNCGPNTLAYMLGLVELTEADGVQLRRIVSDHSKADGVLQRTTSILLEDNSLISIEKLIQLNINHWPSQALQGKPRTIETWQELILQPATWTDVAFVQLTADFFRVSFHHIGVDDRSSVFDMGTISPCDGVSSVALCEIGVWYDRHFVAILDVAPSAQGAKPDAPPPPPSRSSDALSSFTFPLVEVSEARRFIASFERVSLVGFEFSGAMRSALEASFDPSVREAALSVDLRPCDIGGPHYQGDVRDVLHLAAWHRAFFFPPCFQQLRGDLDCIDRSYDAERTGVPCPAFLLKNATQARQAFHGSVLRRRDGAYHIVDFTGGVKTSGDAICLMLKPLAGGPAKQFYPGKHDGRRSQPDLQSDISPFGRASYASRLLPNTNSIAAESGGPAPAALAPHPLHLLGPSPPLRRPGRHRGARRRQRRRGRHAARRRRA